MNNSLIYHGGGMPRSTFQPNSGGSTGKQNYSFNYGNPNDLFAGADISPVNDFFYPCNTNGYYVPENSHVVGAMALITKFSSFCPCNVTFRVRYFSPANGTRTSCIATSTGVFVTDVNVSLPNTGGVNQYYAGNGSLNLSLPLLAGGFLYVYVAVDETNSLTGATFVINLEKD